MRKLSLNIIFAFFSFFAFSAETFNDMPFAISNDINVSIYSIQGKLKNPNLSSTERLRLICILSGMYNKKGKYHQAIQLLESYVFDEKENETTKVRYYLAKAICKKYLDQPKASRQLFNIALKEAKKLKIQDLICEIRIEIGEFHRKFAQFDLAVTEIFKALKYEGSFANPYLKAYGYNRLAAVYNEYTTAYASIEQSRESLKISESLGSLYLMATSYNEMGFSFKHIGNPDSTLYYYRKAEEVFRSLNLTYDAIHAKFNRVEYCAHNNIEMDSTVLWAKDMIKEIDRLSIPYPTEKLYLYLSMSSERKNNLKEALDYYKLYHSENTRYSSILRDKELETIRQDAKTMKIVEDNRQIRYDLDKKQKEINEKDTRNKLILFGFITFLIIAAGILYLYLKMRTLSKELKIKNQQKDFLLQEMHHRVKNNLHFVQSLLEMQENSTDEIEEAIGLHEASVRISSVSLVHEMLYREDSSDRVRVKDYVNDLLQNLIITFNLHDKGVLIEKEIDEVMLSIQDCTALGLLITEIFTNSTKHAFDKVEVPKFYIKLVNYESEKSIELILRDNGPFFDLNADLNKPESLGMRLIDIFSRQLKGTYHIAWENGFVYKMLFYLDEEEGTSS